MDAKDTKTSDSSIQVGVVIVRHLFSRCGEMIDFYEFVHSYQRDNKKYLIARCRNSKEVQVADYSYLGDGDYFDEYETVLQDGFKIPCEEETLEENLWNEKLTVGLRKSHRFNTPNTVFVEYELYEKGKVYKHCYM